MKTSLRHSLSILSWKAFLLCATAFLFSLSAYSQTYQKISLSGFNADLVANGSVSPVASTTTSMDVQGNVMYANGYGFCSSISYYGLPATGAFSSATTGYPYQMANYTGNNALYLPNYGSNGTLAFSTAGSYSSIAILSTSSEGGSSVGVTLNFSDGSTFNTGLNLADWYNGYPYAIAGIGRVRYASSCATDQDGSNPRLYDNVITLSAPYNQKLLTSITFSNTSGGGRPSIFAVTGIAQVGTPSAPIGLFTSNLSTTGFTANWTAVSGATSYVLDVSTSSSFANYYSTYNNLSVGNVTASNVSATTGIYYYRVRAVNAAGQSLSSATTTVTVPAPVAATALNFDGVDDYVAINSPYRAFNKEITVEFWMNAPSATMPFGSVMGQGTSNVDAMTNDVWLMHPNTNGTITFYVNDAGTWRSAQCNITAGSWHHYAGVANATSTSIYVDGVLIISGPGISNSILSNAGAVFHIGKDVRHDVGRFGNFSVDEVRVWSRALCQAEIVNNMNCEPNPASQTGLEEYYRFNQGAVNTNNAGITTLNDLSGKSRNGTLTNFGLTGTTSNWVASGSTNNGTCAAFVAPIAPITGTTSVCLGASSTLANTNTGGVWTSSNTAVATINPSTGVVSTLSAGTTTITYTNTCGGISTTTFTVNAFPTATITPSGSLSFCLGGSVTLTANGGGTSYLWSNGETTQAITILASNMALAGSYTVKVTNASGCSTTSAAANITLYSLPLVSPITGIALVCTGGTSQLSEVTAGGVWSSSNTSVATVNATGLVAGIAAGSATISYSVTNGNGCTTVVNYPISVVALPTATIAAGGPTSFCTGGSVTLTASVGNSYLWSNNATTQAITTSVAGSYSVTVTNTSGCSASSAATVVSVNPLPISTITASGSTTICTGGSITLTASAGSSYLWSNGATTQAITTSVAGPYSVTVTNASGCSASSAATVVSVNSLPAVTNVTGTSTICYNANTVLTATSAATGAVFNWYAAATGGSTLFTGQNYTTASLPSTTTLYVDVTNASGCTSPRTAFTVNVNPDPTVNTVADQVVCAGSTVSAINFSGAVAGTTYNWTNNTSSIGLAASGSGNISAFTAINNTNAPLIASITVTPSTGGAIGYLPNSANGSIQVVDFSTGTITATVPTANGYMRGVLLNANTTKAYFTSINNNITVFNTVNNTVSATIPIPFPTGQTPYAMVLSKDETKLYVTNLNAGNINIINTATNTLASSISMSNTSTAGICMSADGSTLYAAQPNNNRVAVISTATNSVLNYIATGNNPYGVTLSPDGSKLYVTCQYLGNSVSVLSTSTLSSIASIPLGGSPGTGICVSPDGSLVYVSNQGLASVTVINAVTNTILTNIALGSGNTPEGISISADGSKIYAAVYNPTGKVFVINTATNTIASSVAVSALQYSTFAWGNFLKDGLVCTGAAKTFKITVNPLPTATTSKTNVVCPGGNTGSITVTPTSGTAPYQYSNDGGATYVSSNIFGSLVVGNYSIYIKDANGCSNAVGTVSIAQADNVLPTITAPSNITVTLTNGNCTATGIALGTPVTADNCSVASVTNNAPATYPLGNTTVTWTVTDNSNNSATATQTVTVVSPEINITGNNVTIVNGDVTPSTADNTDLGGTLPGVPVSKIFTIQNTGTSALTVSSINSSNGAFAVSGISLPYVVPANGSVNFTATFTASSVGTQTATLTINNNDCDEASYNFAINAAIVCTMPGFINTDLYIQESTDDNSCTAVVSYDLAATGTPAPGLTYLLTGATAGTGAGTGSGVTYNIGITHVVVTAVNPCGTLTTSFDVTVVDDVPPVVVSKNITIYLDQSGKATLNVNDLNGGSHDNCGAVTLSMDHGTICGIATEGNNVFLQAPAGRTIDNIQFASYGTPTGSCGNFQLGGCNSGYSYDVVSAMAIGQNSVSIPAINGIFGDPCYGTPKRLMIQASYGGDGTIATFNCNNLGDNTVTYIVTDAAGNTSTGTAIVTVVDRQGPTISAPDVNVNTTDPTQCGVIANFAATATDCTPGTNTISYSKNPGTFFNIGSTLVTVTATDVLGNVSTAQFNVIVRDASGPVITVPAAISKNNDANQCGALVSFAATATDCSGVNNISYSVQPGTLFPIGLTNVVITATDIFGNQSTASFPVTITDNEPPVITNVPANISVSNDADNCGAVVNYTKPVVIDNCGGQIQTKTFNYSGAQESFVVPVGVTSITVDIAGAAGGKAMYSDYYGGYEYSPYVPFGGRVKAKIPVTPGQILYLNVGGQGQTSTIPAYEGGVGGFNGGGNGTGDYYIISGGGGGASDIRTSNGLESRIVVAGGGGGAGYYIDGGNGGDLIGQDANGYGYPAFGGTQDNGGTGGDYYGYTGSNGGFGYGGNGAYYTSAGGGGGGWYGGGGGAYSNGAGGSSYTTPETVTDVLHTQGYQAGDGYVTFTWNTVLGVTQTTGLPSGATFPVGKTTNTFTASDAAGNVSTVSFDVIVTDTQKPNLTLPANINVNNDANKCGATVMITSATATDNCAVESVIGVRSDALALTADYPIGSTTITWTAIDTHGNATTGTQTITVVDNQLPVIVCPGDMNLYASSASGAVVNYTAPVGTDNCSGVTTVLMEGLASGSTFAIGTTKVTYTATDAAGLTASCSFNVTVTGLPPVIVVPHNISVSNDAGKCGAIVNFEATETTAIPASVITYSIQPNSFFPIGTTNVVATATNAVATSVATFTVTVTDSEVPVVLTQNITIQLGTDGTAVITPGQIDNGSTDNCGIAVYSLDQTSFDCSNIGKVNTVTLSVTDDHGNVNTATAIVSVEDHIAPVVLTKPVTVNLDGTGHTSITVSDVNNGSTDNCAIASYSLDKTTFDCSNIGANTVILTVTDVNGNVSTNTAMVTVQDKLGPVPTLTSLPSVSGLCSAGVVIYSGRCSDNCRDCRVVCKCKDNCRCHRNDHKAVNKHDEGDDDDDCDYDGGDVVYMTTPTAMDNCSGLITATTTDALSYTMKGVHIIHWSFTDANGNTTVQEQTVTITDNVAPKPRYTSLADIHGQCSVTIGITNDHDDDGEYEEDRDDSHEGDNNDHDHWNEHHSGAPWAWDNCAGWIRGTTTDPLTYSSQGTTSIIHWIFDDGHGNITVQEQRVIIADVTAPKPTVSSLPTVYGQCSATVTVVPTAKDNCVGMVSGTTDSPLSYTAQGTYTIVWTYRDGRGNNSTQTQKVVVDDNIKPVPQVSVLPKITGECSVTVSTLPKANDNCAGVITGTTSDPLTYSREGTYTIHWSYDDGNGNTTIQNQTVVINDVTAPVPQVTVLPTLTGECSVTVSTVPTANDNCKGVITATTSDPTTYSRQGTYTIRWTYNDGNGNTATQNQTVVVSDVTRPMILTVPAAATVNCGTSTAPTERATATDNCSTPTITYSDVTAGNTITRTWKATDAAGNYSTATQLLTIVDNTAPTITDVKDVTVVCGTSILPSVTGTAKATDNCGTPTVSYTDASGSNNQIIRTWTATDAFGNSSSSTQTISFSAAFSTSITSVPTSSVYTGGVSTNLYLGYGAQSTSLQVTGLPSSGAPYTYVWSGSYSNQLSSTTSGSPVFTPTLFGYYTFSVTVTNKNGCSSSNSISICVTDVRVPGTNGAQIYVTHTARTKNAVAQTVVVAVNSVSSHIGSSTCGGNGTDRLGSVDQSACNTTVNNATGLSNSGTAKDGESVTVAGTEEDLKVTAMPNPTTTYFTLKIESKYQTPVELRVMDGRGRVVDAKSKIGANSTIQIGHNYSSGTYYAELIQGTQRKVVQLIKGRG